MAKKERLPHVAAAIAEAEKHGATIELDHTKRHIVGVIAINGQTRKVFISITARDGRIMHNVREDVRRRIREMQV